MTMAPAVTSSDPAIIGRMPNRPSDGYQSLDKMKSPRPILAMIGRPALKMNPVMSARPEMAEKAVSMLRRSIEAFINRDAETARAICAEDDEVDALYDQAYHDLLQRMIENPSVIMRATYLIWAAHNVERIADRATNICESVVYLVTGTPGELEVSRY